MSPINPRTAFAASISVFFALNIAMRRRLSPIAMIIDRVSHMIEGGNPVQANLLMYHVLTSGKKMLKRVLTAGATQPPMKLLGIDEIQIGISFTIM